jgi:nitrate/nitrite transporter NarK
VGTAFGIATAIQNIGLTIAPTIVGYIKDKTGGYYWVCAFFVGINLVGLVLNIILYFVDLKYMDGVLNKVDSSDRIEELI